MLLVRSVTKCSERIARGVFRALLLAVVAASLAAPGAAAAQNKKQAEEIEAKIEEVEAEAQEQAAAAEDRMAEIEALIKAQEERIAELEAAGRDSEAEVEELKAEVEELREFKEDQEIAQLEEDAAEASSMEKIFSFWGFFDLTFNKYFFDENSAYNIFLGQRSSFLMTSVNLYFASQMTQTLSALVELRLSYYPHGFDQEWEYVDAPGTEYERTDTTVIDMFTTNYYRQHGIGIERVHLTWAPVDWFNVIAGRFLTPYGIWNIDHGSPVVLPARIPYMQLRDMVPRAQTGLQVYGRFFPTPVVFFDYAVTLSNGRGPMDEVYDLDDNKGVGLRLRLAYEGSDVRVAAGSYGYYGKYTDHKKVIDLELVEDPADPSYGTLDQSVDKPITAELVATAEYDEVVVSADLLFELYGVRLQAEYVWRRVDYETPGLLDPEEIMFAGGTPMDVLYSPSFLGQGFYGLIAYELPLSNWIEPVRITPYFMYEYNRHDDMRPNQNITTYIGGINIKPSPYVTLKVEGGAAVPERNYYGSILRAVTAQMAVSF